MGRTLETLMPRRDGSGLTALATLDLFEEASFPHRCPGYSGVSLATAATLEEI